MAVASNNPVVAAFLDMTRRTTESEIEKALGDMPIERELIKVSNESVDAEQFLNENRKSNPEAQAISDTLKKI